MDRINQEEKAIKNKMEAALLDLRSTVKAKYTELIYAQEIFQLRSEELKSAQDLQNAAQTRYEVGEASALDLMKADIQIVEAQNDCDDALLAVDAARYNLFNTIGIEPEEQKYNLELSDSLSYVDIHINQEEVLSQLDRQPGYVLYTNMLKSANSGVRESWSSFLPNFEASYYRQDFGTGYDFYGYEVGLSSQYGSSLINEVRFNRQKQIKTPLNGRKKKLSLI